MERRFPTVAKTGWDAVSAKPGAWLRTCVLQSRPQRRLETVAPSLHYRPMTLKRFETKKSTIHGTGLFTLSALPARKKVGEMTGEVITIRAARRRAAKLVGEV